MDELVVWLEQYSAGLVEQYRNQGETIEANKAIDKQEVIQEVLAWIEEHKGV